ncbi:MAG: sulfite exporter TauE/SafE family protein [Alphaproteobacteria bacterium]|nr:sulfite exporter TauE/SafE family protein [Alphaproteobacteria bacterium]
MPFYHSNPLYPASGFLVGLLVGMTGVGGGSLMTPLLILLFGVHPVAAVGTDLLYACVTKAVGTVLHGVNRTVDWRITARLATGSVPATALTLLILSQLDIHGSAASRLVSLLLGIALIVTALSLIFRGRIIALVYRRVGDMEPRRAALLTVATGAALGVLVSVSSVGAGALGITALLLLYPRYRMARIVGSDIAHAVPLTLLAGLGHWFLGSVVWSLLGSLLMGSVPGIILGSYLAARVPDVVLRFVLAATLLLVGSKLVV